MRRGVRSTLMGFTVGFLAVTGAAMMYILTYAFPLSENQPISQFFYTVALIALGLAIPYWILRLGIHEAHKRDNREKELNLRDIPKDKHQLAQE